MTTLVQASNEWTYRPPDERFNSIEAARDAILKRTNTMRLAVLDWTALQVKPNLEGTKMLLNGKTRAAELNYHSFGQLCARVKAPADYLRSLPLELAATNLNTGIQLRGDGDNQAKVILGDEETGLECRGLVTTDYSQVLDLDFANRMVKLKEAGLGWQEAPAAFDGSRGQYAGKSNCFFFFVDNTRRIFEKDPNGGLGRGVFVWNSEVGDRSWGFMTFLYEYVCGNHRVWGAKGVQEIRGVHRGQARDKAFKTFEVEIKKYGESSATELEGQIEKARKFTLGATKDEVLDMIFQRGLMGRKKATEAYALAEANEGWYGAPNTAWGFAGGMTQMARDLPNADERTELDRAAGKVLEMAF